MTWGTLVVGFVVIAVVVILTTWMIKRGNIASPAGQIGTSMGVVVAGLLMVGIVIGTFPPIAALVQSLWTKVGFILDAPVPGTKEDQKAPSATHIGPAAALPPAPALTGPRIADSSIPRPKGRLSDDGRLVLNDMPPTGFSLVLFWDKGATPRPGPSGAHVGQLKEFFVGKDAANVRAQYARPDGSEATEIIGPITK